MTADFFYIIIIFVLFLTSTKKVKKRLKKFKNFTMVCHCFVSLDPQSGWATTCSLSFSQLYISILTTQSRTKLLYSSTNQRNRVLLNPFRCSILTRIVWPITGVLMSHLMWADYKTLLAPKKTVNFNGRIHMTKDLC